MCALLFPFQWLILGAFSCVLYSAWDLEFGEFYVLSCSSLVLRSSINFGMRSGSKRADISVALVAVMRCSGLSFRVMCNCQRFVSYGPISRNVCSYLCV